MRIVLTGRRIVAGLGLAVLAGLVVAWSGVVGVGASSGHWRITYHGLHWVMQNSIRTYALFEPEPPADLDGPARIRRAAGHFETACAFCHGSPLNPEPALPTAMTPMPPGLTGAAAKWTPRELSRIVRHGVKYTGMPAWLAPQRSDEVWAMVAFLRALPQMSGEDYRRAAFGQASPEDPALARCARCHGVGGGSSGGAFPMLAGQSEDYLVEALAAYDLGTRPSGFMRLAVDGVSESELRRLARHYASQPGLSEVSVPDGSAGSRIAFEGLPARDVPACESCHGASARRNPSYPRLSGQDAAYLAAALRRMGEDAPLNPRARIMHTIAKRLPDAAIDAVADFYAARGGAPSP
ncbi:c-type cytochrome [Starkeya koreensis]|uniref:C-type cytochrome n=1 Tax=Ancylobacter koreensis TaxID=266121 RepID=A0ABT0DL17_9HYPH|nr:c-type cytochrome [Ancylobacter koreensis]MCK0207950.1 c-type cytochrome [Ancylobacter koreensis]